MINFYKNNKKHIDNILVLTSFILLIYIFIVYIFKFVAPFLFAFIVSLIMEPLVRFLNEKLKINRGIAAIFCIIILVLSVGIMGTYLFSKIWKEAQSFIIDLPFYIKEVSNILIDFQLKFNYDEVIPLELKSFFENIVPNIVSYTTTFLGEGVKDKSLSFFSFLPKTFMWVILFVISTFFFIKDKFIIRKAVIDNCPIIILKYYQLFKKGIFDALGGYIKAQTVIMSIIAIINILGLIIIRYPYALFMGIIIALIDALPVFGSGAIILPWCVISFISGDFTKAISLLILYVINFLIRQLIEPKILSSQIGVYPLITLMSIYIGLKVFGALGFIIGPIIVITIKIFKTADYDI